MTCRRLARQLTRSDAWNQDPRSIPAGRPTPQVGRVQETASGTELSLPSTCRNVMTGRNLPATDLERSRNGSSVGRRIGRIEPTLPALI